MDYTIAQEFVLPSKGLIYDREVNPNIKIRSMTTAEEMKRLAYSETPYKNMSEIIDACLVEKPGIPVYDMCIGDYQFLLHRLRMVTYGSDYNIQVTCPYCGSTHRTTIKLDKLDVLSIDEDINSLLEFELPVTGKKVKLRFQTPRTLDEIASRQKDLKTKATSNDVDFTLPVLLQTIIEKIDGKVIDPAKLETFVRQLPMRDTNRILRMSEKINEKVGIKTELKHKCNSCRRQFNSSFRITSEFFGPTED